jgi:peptide/nickel transport system substrate-binding protein
MPAGALSQTIRFSPGTPAPTAFNAAAGRYEEGASFDPYLCAEQPCGELVHNVFDGLVSVSERQTIEPALATRWAVVDPVRYRFVLRRGVRFHNGERFDAARPQVCRDPWRPNYQPPPSSAARGSRVVALVLDVVGPVTSPDQARVRRVNPVRRP